MRFPVLWSSGGYFPLEKQITLASVFSDVREPDRYRHLTLTFHLAMEAFLFPTEY